jgi:hypothetical protein
MGNAPFLPVKMADLAWWLVRGVPARDAKNIAPRGLLRQDLNDHRMTVTV